jgi:hypothetical protein
LRGKSQVLHLLVIAICFEAGAAFACSCDEEAEGVSQAQQVKSEFKRSDFVAEIEIESATESTESREGSGLRWDPAKKDHVPARWIEHDELLIAKFRILKLWKGDSGLNTVRTNRAWQACGLPFKAGDRVLLYASRGESSGQLGSNSCSRTKPLRSAQDDLAVLGKVAPDGSSAKQNAPTRAD